jgi:hypothetical protein
MRHSTKYILFSGWLCAAVLGASACSPRRIPPLTVEDMMEDRVTLDGILLKCNQNQARRGSSDCQNARIASERLAVQNVDPADEKKHQEDFERAREQLRLTQEKVRQEQEAKKKVDPYTLPLVPVDPANPPKGDGPSAGNPSAKSDLSRGNPPPTAATTTP